MREIRFRQHDLIDGKLLLSVLTEINIDEMPGESGGALNFLLKSVLDSFDKHAPITFKSSNLKYYGPAFSSKTLRLIQIEKHHYQRRIIIEYNNVHLKLYTKLIFSSITEDMKRYSSNIIKKTGAWSLFNTLKLRNQKLYKLPPHETYDSLNQYFCTVAFLKPEDKIDTLLSETALNPDPFHFTVINVTKSDFYLAWKQTKTYQT